MDCAGFDRSILRRVVRVKKIESAAVRSTQKAQTEAERQGSREARRDAGARNSCLLELFPVDGIADYCRGN